MALLWQLGAGELAEGFRSGAFTPADALEAVLDRAAACQPAVNAFVHLDAEGAQRSARESAARWKSGKALSALDGVPVSLKDNLHARGLPTSWGSALIRDWRPAEDELPVAKLRASGAVIFGKTNLPEFALQGITDNLVFGTTRNPWDTALTPGGSSGGGAAAVAAGCGPVALVTDGGGSTRRPASHTGVVGFKPSGGLIARGNGLPEIFLHYEVPGVLARSVADALALVRVLAHAKWTDAASARSRILFVPRFGDHPVDPGIAKQAAEAARRFESLGHAVDTSGRADWSEEVNAAWPLISAAGLAWMLDDASRLPEARGAIDLSRCTASARSNVALGSGVDPLALFNAFASIHALCARMDALFETCDFILTPATAALPWPAQESHPSQIAGQEVGPRGHAVFTAFANAAGLPAIAVPCGFVDGLPTGFQLVGRAGSDAALLALAAQYEQAFPPHARWPAVDATMAAA